MLIRGLIALAFGTLGLGIAEFVAMGLLPYWSQDFGVTTAESGYAISAYAIGVSIGAFVTIVMRKLKLKTILIFLILVHIVGNGLTAFASSFDTLLIARFIAGLPHGAYFGVGSIIAQRLAAKGRGTSAVSIMVAGMTISNIFGVPLGTALANFVSWRAIFFIVVLWGVLVLVSAILWIKDTGKIKDTGFKGQFAFLKDPAPWIVLGATMLGNAGIFCMHSYISPILTDMAGLALKNVAAVLVAIGITMVAFNLISGRIGDMFTPGKVAFAFQIFAGLSLLGITFFGQDALTCIVLACITSGCMFAISAPEQVAILRVSPGGMLLGASMIQAAFNLGNALGAGVGGLPFTFGMPIQFVTVFGAILVVGGVFLLYKYAFKHEARFKDPTEEDADNEHQHDGLAQAQGAMDIQEFGMSDEVMAKHELARAARHAAEAAASEVYARAHAAKLAAKAKGQEINLSDTPPSPEADKAEKEIGKEAAENALSSVDSLQDMSQEAIDKVAMNAAEQAVSKILAKAEESKSIADNKEASAQV